MAFRAIFGCFGLLLYLLLGLRVLGLYWGYIGIMEKKMETTVMGLGFGVLGLGVLGLGFGGLGLRGLGV